MASGTEKIVRAILYIHITKSQCHHTSLPNGPYTLLCRVTGPEGKFEMMMDWIGTLTTP